MNTNTGENPPPYCSNVPSQTCIISCPTCGKIPFITLVSVNEVKCECSCSTMNSNTLTLNDFFDKYCNKTQREEYCYNTKKHNEVKASTFCFQCQKWICEKCLEVHNDFMGDHETTTLPLLQTKCLFHKDENITYFCKDCNEHICNLCKDKHKKQEIYHLENDFSDEKLNKYSEDLEAVKDILLNYNTNIKNKLVTLLKETIQKIEDSYKKNTEINLNFLKFYTLLLDNFKVAKNAPNYVIFSNMKKIQLNLKKSNFNEKNSLVTNINAILDYFDNNFIISPKVDFSSLENKKSLLESEGNEIVSLIKLSNGNLAITSSNKTVSIYDSQSFQLIESFKTQASVNYLCELEDERFVTSGGNITFWKKDKERYQPEQIIKNSYQCYKVIALQNNMIAVGTYPGILIWNSQYPFNAIKTLYNSYNYYYSLLLLKDGTLCASTSSAIEFYDLVEMKLDHYLDVNGALVPNALLEIDNNHLLVGGKDTITLIDILSHSVIGSIKDPEFGVIKSVGELRDRSLILGTEKGSFYHFDSNIKFLKKSTNVHKTQVTCILPLDFDTFVSTGKEIKLWKY